MIRYFRQCKTTQELKSEYRKQAKILHPDFSKSDGAEFRAMVSEYNEKSIELLKSNTEFKASNDTEKTMKDFKNIIDELLKYKNLDIEICGNWIWLSGETRPIKDIIKGLGFYWASKKKQWYFRPAEFKSSKNRKSQSMENIRLKYGSIKIESSKQKSIAL